MNKKITFLFAALIFLVGFMLGSIILTSSAILDLINPPLPNQLGTDYNYKFILSSGGTCDLKSLKSNLHYEGLPWIDQALLIYPELEIGFFKPLSKENETLLLELMDKRDQEMCNPPQGITYEFTAIIHPDSIAKHFEDNFGIKSYYIANGLTGEIVVSIKEPIDLTTSINMRNSLCNLWGVNEKK